MRHSLIERLFSGFLGAVLMLRVDLSSSKGLRRAASLALAAVVLLTAAVPTVSADNRFPWHPQTWTLGRSTSTWRTGSDSMYFWARMTWDADNASNMRHMATHGYRFTHDVQDTSNDGAANNNLNATGRYSTTMPSPYYDRDRSGFRNHEAEITSESSAFPSSGVEYISLVEFSHWYSITGSTGTNWFWDPSGDSVTQPAQVSAPGCPVLCDKWDAAQGLADKIMGYTAYPSKAAPAAAPVAEADVVLAEGAVSQGARASGKAAYKVERHHGQIVLEADLSDGLRAYLDTATAAATTIAVDGASRGILTFAEPVTFADLRALERQGVIVETIEAVTANDHGPRWTLGSPMDDATAAWIRDAAAETGERLLGITSAQVVVDASSLRNALDDPLVYLVDLSIEHFGRGHADKDDIVMNDVYWAVAGWE